MPDPVLYLKAMGAAAIASAMVVLAMAGPRRSAGTTWLTWACVLGIGFGLAAGCYLLSVRFIWPPVKGLDRFITIVVPAVLAIELIAGFQRVPRWAAWFLRISLAAATPRILLHGSVYLSGADGEWTMWQAGATLIVCGVLLAGVWSLMSWLSLRTQGVLSLTGSENSSPQMGRNRFTTVTPCACSLGGSIPFALSLSILCAGVTVMLAGYIKGGAAAFPLAATVVATTLAAVLVTSRCGIPATFNPSAIIGIGVVGLFGLLFIGRFYGRLSTESALTMLLAPLLCWVTELPLLRNRKPWLVGLVRLALVAIPLVVVLVLAKRDFDLHMAPLLSQISTLLRGS